MVIKIIWCVKIYNLKLKRKTNYTDGFNFNRDFECDSHPIEKNIDVGCFNPENWDNMIRMYMKKRATP